jgi:hypothetical protein
MSARYFKSSGYIRFKREYYYHWYCAKKVYKNIKFQDKRKCTKNPDNIIKVSPRSYLGTIRHQPNYYRCKLDCPSMQFFNDRYVCLEGKAISADWVEKNL